MDSKQGQLERFHPLMLKNILEAVRRFEPDFYAHLCRTYHLDADRIIGLFSVVEELGAGQLQPLLRDLRMHQAYHDIVYLAGRNSLVGWAEDNHFEGPRIGSMQAKFTSSVKSVLHSFLGHATTTAMVRGSLHFIEVRNSIFARDTVHERPLCGFYCGMLAELVHLLGEGGPAAVLETRCCAVDSEAPTCLLQISL